MNFFSYCYALYFVHLIQTMCYLLHSGTTQAEKRKKIIEESKFLGGDMEHTHLVKGLDYALLDKVRAEINNKETNDEDIEAAAEMAEEEIE